MQGTITQPASNPSYPNEPLTQFAKRYIRKKSRELIRHPGLNRSDQEDLEQDLTLDLLTRFEKYDPQVAHYNKFVVTIVERRAASIVRFRRAKIRTHKVEGESLNQIVDDGDGNQIDLISKVEDGHLSSRTGKQTRSSEDLVNLTEDIHRMLECLLPEERKICLLLQTHSITSASQVMGIPRSNLCRKITVIRARFKAELLDEYV